MDRVRRVAARNALALGLIALGSVAASSLLFAAAAVADDPPGMIAVAAIGLGGGGVALLGAVLMIQSAATNATVRTLAADHERLSGQLRKLNQQLQENLPRRAWSELDPDDPGLALADLAQEINDDLARIVDMDQRRVAAILNDLWARIEAVEDRIVGAIAPPDGDRR